MQTAFLPDGGRIWNRLPPQKSSSFVSAKAFAKTAGNCPFFRNIPLMPHFTTKGAYQHDALAGTRLLSKNGQKDHFTEAPPLNVGRAGHRHIPLNLAHTLLVLSQQYIEGTKATIGLSGRAKGQYNPFERLMGEPL